uniref:Opsin 1 (cone pigments), short-wave-sensitive 2 n=1 Tax=Nothobranchius furzeri TaxID=105023 RepID=A0A8C6M600_NOTFU
MRFVRSSELPDDFWIQVALDTNNITSLSSFQVPRDHLGSLSTFYAMAGFMFFVCVAGTSINTLTIECTVSYKKLRSHFSYILRLTVANLLVSAVACKIEGKSRLNTLFLISRHGKSPLGNFASKPEHATACCMFTWAFALIASVPPLCFCGPDWYTTNTKYNNESHMILPFCFCFVVPFTMIVFCYTQLLITLKMAAKAQAESTSTQKAEKEVTRMVVVMVLTWCAIRLHCLIYTLLNKQVSSSETSTTQSVTKVYKVGPA